MILIVSFVFCGTAKAEQSKLPVGKYLALMQNADKPKENKKIAIEITSEGILSIFFVTKRKPMPLARVKSEKAATFSLEFNPLFDARLSGDYKLKYFPNNQFQLTSNKNKMFFFPFIEQEVVVSNQRKKEIIGRWFMKRGNETWTLDFKLPYTLEIKRTQEYESSSSSVFWVSQANGEDITVSATLFFDVFAGTLKKVRIENGDLCFTYKGKQYKMKNIEKVRN